MKKIILGFLLTLATCPLFAKSISYEEFDLLYQKIKNNYNFIDQKSSELPNEAAKIIKASNGICYVFIDKTCTLFQKEGALNIVNEIPEDIWCRDFSSIKGTDIEIYIAKD